MTAPIAPRIVDRIGGIEVCPLADGRVRLSVWTEDRAPEADADTYVMTPGQALALMGKLPNALRTALMGTLS